MKLSGENLHKLSNDQWVSLDLALSPETLDQLKKIAQNRWDSGLFQPAKVGRSQEQKEAPQIRNDWTSWIDLNDPQFAFFAAEIEELKSELNQNLFLGIQDFECHFARYSSGQYYDEHIDQARLKSFLHGERVISFVLYLNENWKPGDGGELSIRLSKPENLVEPRWGRLLLFRSDTVPHAVMPAHQDRWSLTGWFRRT